MYRIRIPVLAAAAFVLLAALVSVNASRLNRPGFAGKCICAVFLLWYLFELVRTAAMLQQACWEQFASMAFIGLLPFFLWAGWSLGCELYDRMASVLGWLVVLGIVFCVLGLAGQLQWQALAKTMLRLTGVSWLYVGGMEYEGRLISIAMAERCGETLHVHIEKALYGYEGVYPATVQEFARCYAVDGVRYLNREDDAGDRGLRTSKLQYLPCKLAEKFCFDVKNEVEDLDEIPTLKTERLTLSAFTDKDREAYNALCLDDERNKWWGYDYRTDWKGEDLDSYFLDVVREDFAKKRAINFAIRLDGKCIGEVLLYRFDGKGGAEEGCRIAPEYGGQGYGVEAFRAVAEWGLYQRHLGHVVAKCFKENDASYKMLSSCMRKKGEDEKFFYFNKEV